jgi:hypothetical protein
VPGCKLSIRYWPVESVVAERAFSISAGLDASTVTPGSTAPDASLTVPARVTCAHTALGTIAATTSSISVRIVLRIDSSSFDICHELDHLDSSRL